VSLLVVVSLFVALADPAPAGPPVAPPAVVAEASPDPALCALSRAPLGLDVSLLTALDDPAPTGPPVAAAAASPELDCANASVELSISKEDNVIVVSFMGCPFEFSGQQWSGS
jgi:hypothetical protein